jgi:hypothetical protein
MRGVSGLDESFHSALNFVVQLCRTIRSGCQVLVCCVHRILSPIQRGQLPQRPIGSPARLARRNSLCNDLKTRHELSSPRSLLFPALARLAPHEQASRPVGLFCAEHLKQIGVRSGVSLLCQLLETADLTRFQGGMLGQLLQTSPHLIESLVHHA